VLGAAILSLLIVSPALAACELGKLLELPVTMRGDQPMVTAQINGHDVRFVLDSGAFYSNITPGSAKEFDLPLEPGPPGFWVGGIGGSTTPMLTRVKTFGLGPAKLPNIQFLVGGSEVGGVGLLGQNVLGIADVEYDLAHGIVRLMRPHGCEKLDLAYWVSTSNKTYSVVPIESLSEARYHTQGTVFLNGVKIRAVFDTGAGRTMLTTAAARRAGIVPGGPGVEPAGYVHGIGRKTVKTWIGPFQSLKIGDNEEIQKIRLRFGDISDDNFDMLIGADFFLSHHVYVANKEGKLFLTYNGGPVFDLSRGRDMPDAEEADAPTPGIAANPSAPPTTADDYSRLGAALLSRNDPAGAKADFDKAIGMQPSEARYYVQRAGALSRSREPAKALADLNHALTLDPANVDALEFRAGLRLRRGDKAGARADADALDKALATPADARLGLAGIYDRLGAVDQAVTQYDDWISAHSQDSRLPEAYNGRCWVRAQAGRDLPQAIDDCSHALRLAPHTASFLDSRGLAELRAGQLDKAARDYDASLAINPKTAWSLYGRGIVRLKQGDKAGGDADLAAAKAIDPKLSDEAEAHGITPP
jgi:tetratricopeptide (TPR) repeat protein/predicted aspartyl protease